MYQELGQQTTAHLHSPARGQVVTALKAVGDYLTLTAGLAAHEDTILHASVEALLAQHGKLMTDYPQARQATLADERFVLRACALSLLTGGAPQYEAVVEILRTIIQHIGLDRQVVLDGYALLQQACEQHLQAGPVQLFTRALAHTAQRLVA